MVGHHVAQSAGGFVKRAAMLDAHGFRCSYLDVINVGAIPQRLDNAVGKAENHYVLDSFFSQIMIDTVDLLFTQNFFQFFVQLNRGFQIMAKRLFDDHPRPTSV